MKCLSGHTRFDLWCLGDLYKISYSEGLRAMFCLTVVFLWLESECALLNIRVHPVVRLDKLNHWSCLLSDRLGTTVPVKRSRGHGVLIPARNP